MKHQFAYDSLFRFQNDVRRKKKTYVLFSLQEQI